MAVLTKEGPTLGTKVGVTPGRAPGDPKKAPGLTEIGAWVLAWEEKRT